MVGLDMMQTAAVYIVTGGAGFIGSALCRYLIRETNAQVICIDKLTYAASLDNLASIKDHANFFSHQIDIADKQGIAEIFDHYRPDAVINLAAETHVDRSIDGPAAFIETNVIGTFNLLETTLRYWRGLTEEKAELFRFLHVSTDEVYGSLDDDGAPFSETTPYSPRSPYSASKASSDHLVNAWHHTYGLPTLITNCSNNYGPYQFPEKLIPLTIIKALRGEPIPVYGSGLQVRDWLFVEDHVRAIHCVLTRAKPGSTFNIGGSSEKKNIEVIQTICDIIDDFKARSHGVISRACELITHVKDRPGHDFRYAIDSRKLKEQLNWEPKETFELGMRKTVDWYLNHPTWWELILEQRYNAGRLGLSVTC